MFAWPRLRSIRRLCSRTKVTAVVCFATIVLAVLLFRPDRELVAARFADGSKPVSQLYSQLLNVEDASASQGDIIMLYNDLGSVC
jgi:hypothetical protein